MSNLLKYNQIVIKNDNKLVIDSNKMVQTLLEERNAVSTEPNFAQAAKTPDEDGFVCGLDAQMVEQLISDEADVVDTATKKSIEEANSEAAQILEDAKKEAERIYEEAKHQGYDDGINEGRTYINQVVEEKENEVERKYQKRIAELEAEFEQRYAEMEPALVETLLEVFAKVTLTIAEDKKDVIVMLIERVLRNADANKDFLIRVSEVDYKFVLNNKHKIEESASPDAKIEITRDGTLGKNQCIVETDAGVFDCSLDIQLENLVGEIRLLCCLNDIKK